MGTSGIGLYANDTIADLMTMDTAGPYSRAMARQVVVCSCCGEERDAALTATLRCLDDIRVCRDCIGWLSQRAGIANSTPTLPVVDMDAAVAFYEQAGFDVRRYDDGFAFAAYDDDSVFDLDLRTDIDPARNGAGCYIIPAEVHAWHARLSAAGLAVGDIEDKPWGMREFTLTDPSHNNVRIGRGV